MPLARQKRVEGVSRLGRDSVAIGSRLGRVGAENVAKSRPDFLDWVADASGDAEDKTQKSPISNNWGIGRAPAARCRAFLCFC